MHGGGRDSGEIFISLNYKNLRFTKGFKTFLDHGHTNVYVYFLTLSLMFICVFYLHSKIS